MRPIIGITMYSGENRLAPEIKVPTQHLPVPYIEAVRRAGGVPLLIPAGTMQQDAQESAEAIDGLLLSGGPDIDPARYGQQMIPGTGTPDRTRDYWENALFGYAMSYNMPILGVCRGMQMINVSLGGTLTQELENPGLHGGIGYTTHPVMIEPDSLLGGLMPYEDEAVEVTTRHHHAVARLGDDLAVVATMFDGTIEAIEYTRDDRFVIGVQWHPERDHDQGVFTGLVVAAAKYQAENA